MASSQNFKDLFLLGTGVFRTADYSTNAFGQPVTHITVASFNPGPCDGIVAPESFVYDEGFGLELIFPSPGVLAHHVLPAYGAFEWSANDVNVDIQAADGYTAYMVVYQPSKNDLTEILVTCTSTAAYSALFGPMLVNVTIPLLSKG